jgi:hypothetical protein
MPGGCCGRRSSPPRRRGWLAEEPGACSACRHAGGVSDGAVTALADAGYAGLITRVTSQDSFVPLGPAANTVLLDEPTIEKAAVGLPHAG